MKINLSYPATGCQKLVEIADELKVRRGNSENPSAPPVPGTKNSKFIFQLPSGPTFL